jgi:hypothetical protein
LQVRVLPALSRIQSRISHSKRDHGLSPPSSIRPLKTGENRPARQSPVAQLSLGALDAIRTTMTPEEKAQLIDEIRRSRLAQNDLRQVIAAATALKDEHLNGDLCRALETAIVICYARPFTKSNVIGPIKESLVPPDLRALHNDLIRARNKVYAHTDLTDARDVVDVGALLELDAPAYAEQWRPLDRDGLVDILRLAVEIDKP